MKTKYYLAYGSNLNIDQMSYRCPDAVPVSSTVLKDWRLLFKGSKSGYYLTIEPHKGSEVPVGVFKISALDEMYLDRYEGFPNFYYKKFLPVTFLDYDTDEEISAEAMVYIMHEDRPVGLPSPSYVLVCRQGYRDFGFDTQFLLDALTASRKEVA